MTQFARDRYTRINIGPVTRVILLESVQELSYMHMGNHRNKKLKYE